MVPQPSLPQRDTIPNVATRDEQLESFQAIVVPVRVAVSHPPFTRPGQVVTAVVPGSLLAVGVASFVKWTTWLIDGSPISAPSPQGGPLTPHSGQESIRPRSERILQEVRNTDNQ